MERASSPWASPILLVPKADGKLRPVIDLRRVNALAKRDEYPTPDVTETLHQVAGHRWVSKIDLSSAFWQIPLHPKSRDYTAFMTRKHGLMRWKVLPMGFTNSSNIFQREIDHALGTLRYEMCSAFCDDVAVYSDGSLEDHLLKVQQVLRALRNAGFSGNPDKCLFAQHETEFLGHIVSKEGMQMQPEKFNALLNYARPTTKSGLRSFLGLASYYRTFVQSFGSIAAPLTSLLAGTTGTKKQKKMSEKEPWAEGTWTDTHQQAFEALKGALLSAPILSPPVKGRRYMLATDASNHSFGAVLAQWDEHGKERPIAYLSKKLTESQAKWLIWEKELAAAVWATTLCRPYLIGQPFDLFTDNKVIEARWQKTYLQNGKIG